MGPMMGGCISIRIPPEKGCPQSSVFAGKVIRNFECIIELYMFIIRMIRSRVVRIKKMIFVNLVSCPQGRPFPYCNGQYCCSNQFDYFGGVLTFSSCSGCMNDDKEHCPLPPCEENCEYYRPHFKCINSWSSTYKVPTF